MDDDWEENIYGDQDLERGYEENYEENYEKEYQYGEEREEEYEEDEDFGRKDFEEDLGGEREDEGPDFRLGYAESKQLGLLDVAQGKIDIGKKYAKSPEDIALDMIRGILYSKEWEDVSAPIKKRAMDILLDVKNIENLNLETIVAAAIWKAEKNPLNKNNFEGFSSEHNEISKIDLLRYIRLLS